LIPGDRRRERCGGKRSNSARSTFKQAVLTDDITSEIRRQPIQSVKNRTVLRHPQVSDARLLQGSRFVLVDLLQQQLRRKPQVALLLGLIFQQNRIRASEQTVA
jgi:hypothetical protein